MKKNIVITILISSLFLVLSICVFSVSYLRLWEGGRDVLHSFAYYFSELFGGIWNVVPTVLEPSNNIHWETNFPVSFAVFRNRLIEYFRLFLSKENVSLWLVSVGEIVGKSARVLCLILPVTVGIVALIHHNNQRKTTVKTDDTKPLKAFKKLSGVVYVPIRNTIKGYIDFLKEYPKIRVVWMLVWVLNLNLFGILLEFIAYYLFFAVTFRTDTIYFQFYKLACDLQVIVRNVPLWCIVSGIVLAWLQKRKKIALNKLRNLEAKNCRYIEDLPIVSLVCGSMGMKKTTMITDMALSQEKMFRQRALEILQENDLKFPHFPWRRFEQELECCMEHGTVYNLATVESWIAKKKTRYAQKSDANLQLYGYDIHRYGDEFNTALRVEKLFEVLKIYASAYLIYVTESSLIVSNFAIRTDEIMTNVGNFPLWEDDYFPETITQGRFSHVLDFDILRLGKKVIQKNVNNGSFEFGVIAITEIGKERGNNLELREVKKGTWETNQKNDLFNSWLKMCRHSAIVEKYPFVKVFADEQRPESWGADARDLSEVIRVSNVGKQKLALPFYDLEEMLNEWLLNRFLSLYLDFRFRRGDNTLFMYLLKSVTQAVWRHNLRIQNRFGYSVLATQMQSGTMDGAISKKRYYLMNQKIYSRRFSTDCFSDYFRELAKTTKVGLNDYREYVSERASLEELRLQNSYFMDSLYRFDKHGEVK